MLQEIRCFSKSRKRNFSVHRILLNPIKISENFLASMVLTFKISENFLASMVLTFTLSKNSGYLSYVRNASNFNRKTWLQKLMRIFYSGVEVH